MTPSEIAAYIAAYEIDPRVALADLRAGKPLENPTARLLMKVARLSAVDRLASLVVDSDDDRDAYETMLAAETA